MALSHEVPKSASLESIVLPYSLGFTLAEQAIRCFLEWRDQHGYAESEAIARAASEFAEGMSIDVKAEIASFADGAS